MTIGTATVATTKVLSTTGASRSRLPSVRFRTMSVGTTASQIMKASWCFVGGGTCGRDMCAPSGGEGRAEGGGDVVGDEVVVDGDGGGGALAGGGDDLRARVDGVAGDPQT